MGGPCKGQRLWLFCDSVLAQMRAPSLLVWTQTCGRVAHPCRGFLARKALSYDLCSTKQTLFIQEFPHLVYVNRVLSAGRSIVARIGRARVVHFRSKSSTATTSGGLLPLNA